MFTSKGLPASPIHVQESARESFWVGPFPAKLEEKSKTITDGPNLTDFSIWHGEDENRLILEAFIRRFEHPGMSSAVNTILSYPYHHAVILRIDFVDTSMVRVVGR